jgi:hypothetical protein
MTIQEFIALCEMDSAPFSLSTVLRSLWFDKRGDWNRAHEEVQDGDDECSAAMHAYLHRKEGDLFNARYWYHRAKRTPFKGTLEEEWSALVEECLGRRI